MKYIDHKLNYYAGVANFCIYCNTSINELISLKNIDEINVENLLEEIYNISPNNIYINKFSKIKCLSEKEFIIKNIIE